MSKLHPRARDSLMNTELDNPVKPSSYFERLLRPSAGRAWLTWVTSSKGLLLACCGLIQLNGSLSERCGGDIGHTLARLPRFRWIHRVDPQEVCPFTVSTDKQVLAAVF